MNTITKYRKQPAIASPLGDLMNEFFGRDIGHFLGSDQAHQSSPRVNIIERGNEHELQLLAPGFSKSELKLKVEDDLLTISAEKEHPALKENERYTRREFSLGSFKRSFRLPENVKVEEIKAAYENGVLTLHIPKVAEQRPQPRSIEIA